MKSLYEARNFFVGDSPVCSYVWADSEDEARVLAYDAFRASAERYGYPRRYYANLDLTLLFTSDAPSFATIPSDSGWDAPPWL